MALAKAVSAVAPESARGKQRRARILKAATALFLETGYSGTSIDAIVEQSGGSKATLYSYFSTKEVLFRAVIDRVVSRSDVSTLDGSKDIRETLCEFAVRRMRIVFSQRHRALLRVIIEERDRFPDIARAYYELGPKGGHGLLVKYLAEKGSRGQLRIEDPEQAAESLVGMLIHRWYTEQLYLQRPPPSLADMRDRAARVVDRFLESHGVR